jgi:hypothetical protein
MILKRQIGKKISFVNFLAAPLRAQTKGLTCITFRSPQMCAGAKIFLIRWPTSAVAPLLFAGASTL